MHPPLSTFSNKPSISICQNNIKIDPHLHLEGFADHKRKFPSPALTGMFGFCLNFIHLSSNIIRSIKFITKFFLKHAGWASEEPFVKVACSKALCSLTQGGPRGVKTTECVSSYWRMPSPASQFQWQEYVEGNTTLCVLGR
jgi:hypothetical protein